MTVDNFALVKDRFFNQAGIDEQFLAERLGFLKERKIDFGDLFFEHEISESFSLDEGIIKNGTFAISGGVGVRAVLGEKCGFAYADSFLKDDIIEACRAARSISSGHNCDSVAISQLRHQIIKPLYVADNPLESLTRERKIEILKTVDRLARESDERIDQVRASISQSHRLMLVANTDGTICADIKPVVSFNVSVVMKHGKRIESGSNSMGGAYLLDEIVKDNAYVRVVKEAVRIASVNLEAVAAPAGAMPVILGAGWPGVLIHEAVGHGLEADANYTKMSAYSGKIGEKVASSACTIIDDGTMPYRRGSQSCDDEGTPTQKNVLIENGILKGYMNDRKTANLMHVKPSGNGRRENYSSMPMPRMTNTYMMPGKYDKNELISTVERGVYAVNFKGGQVDITSGRFVFTASEAYLIEKGKISHPIKGITLIGNGPETMKKVSMVANDLEFDPGIGFCGKAGQSVMVGIGQPTLKVDEITVGGTSSRCACD